MLPVKMTAITQTSDLRPVRLLLGGTMNRYATATVSG